MRYSRKRRQTPERFIDHAELVGRLVGKPGWGDTREKVMVELDVRIRMNNFPRPLPWVGDRWIRLVIDQALAIESLAALNPQAN